MPVIILAIAGAFAFWASQREARRMAEVRQVVLNLCHDVASGKDVSAQLSSMMPVENPGLFAALKSACPSPEAAAALDVKVTPGDLDDIGHFSGTASHTAVVQVGGVEVLSLRIKYGGDAHHIQILGYRLP